jgi:hypothetical protein
MYRIKLTYLGRTIAQDICDLEIALKAANDIFIAYLRRNKKVVVSIENVEEN